jgi:hypothetical protein
MLPVVGQSYKHIASRAYYEVMAISRCVSHPTQFSVIYKSLDPSTLRNCGPPLHLPAGTIWHRDLEDFRQKFEPKGNENVDDTDWSKSASS